MKKLIIILSIATILFACSEKNYKETYDEIYDEWHSEKPNNRESEFNKLLTFKDQYISLLDLIYVGGCTKTEAKIAYKKALKIFPKDEFLSDHFWGVTKVHPHLITEFDLAMNDTTILQSYNWGWFYIESRPYDNQNIERLNYIKEKIDRFQDLTVVLSRFSRDSVEIDSLFLKSCFDKAFQYAEGSENKIENLVTLCKSVAGSNKNCLLVLTEIQKLAPDSANLAHQLYGEVSYGSSGIIHQELLKWVKMFKSEKSSFYLSLYQERGEKIFLDKAFKSVKSQEDAMLTAGYVKTNTQLKTLYNIVKNTDQSHEFLKRALPQISAIELDKLSNSWGTPKNVFQKAVDKEIELRIFSNQRKPTPYNGGR